MNNSNTASDPKASDTKKTDSFASYPTHRVCAIIENSVDAKLALEGLLSLGLKREDIEILGKSDSDSRGAIVTTTYSMGDVENEAFQVYQSGLEKGNYVFSVLAESDEAKDSVSALLTKNNAHYVNYFGTWVVQGL